MLHTIVPTQEKMGFLKADDTILVLLQNFLTANNVKASEYSKNIHGVKSSMAIKMFHVKH